jgi:hypothetical protein
LELHHVDKAGMMEDTKPKKFSCETYGSDGRLIVFVNITGKKNNRF